MSTIKVDTIATRTGSGNITLSNNVASLTSSGNITAAGTLAVTGLSTFSSDITVTESNANASTDITILNANGVATVGNQAKLHLGTTNSTSHGASIIGEFTGTANTNHATDLIFKTTTTGSSLTEAARIDNAGNLMVGVTSKNSANNGSITIGHTGMTKITGAANGNADELVLIGANASANVGMSIISNNANQGIIYFGDEDDTDIGGIIYDHASNFLAFQTNTTEQLRLHSNGVLAASDGISLGVGVNNTASNVLDDYEEGTFTGVGLSAASGGAFTITSQDNAYVKIGKFVKVRIKLIFNSPSSASGNITLTGLPFASDGIYGMHIIYNNQSASYNNDGGFFISGTQAVKYGYSTSFQNINTFQIWMEASYRTT